MIFALPQCPVVQEVGVIFARSRAWLQAVGVGSTSEQFTLALFLRPCPFRPPTETCANLNGFRLPRKQVQHCCHATRHRGVPIIWPNTAHICGRLPCRKNDAPTDQTVPDEAWHKPVQVLAFPPATNHRVPLVGALEDLWLLPATGGLNTFGMWILCWRLAGYIPVAKLKRRQETLSLKKIECICADTRPQTGTVKGNGDLQGARHRRLINGFV
mmetsp:Transcript_58575/g.116158  ORF Transcript_58575/g.116158 Transcript_58575/m.116158 type:complete len:214 (+) Transcript_58575:764-1405(+)